MELFKRYKCLFARYKIRRVEHINVEAMGAILDRGLPLQDGRNHTRRIFPLEGPLAGQHFIEDAAEAEQVASASTVLPCNCSGDMYCTVPRIDPATVSPLGHGRLAPYRWDLLGEAEIQGFHALLRNQYVGRLQIAMHDALAVSHIQRVQDLASILHGLAEWKRPLQRRTFHELHYQVVRTDVVKLADQHASEGLGKRRPGRPRPSDAAGLR